MPVQVSVKIEGWETLVATIQELGATSKDFRPLAKKIRHVISESTKKNFDAWGRPTRWPDRWKALESIFPVLEGKAPLNVSGHLRQMATQAPEVTLNPNSFEYGVKTTGKGGKDYAYTQQFGGLSNVTIPEDKIRHIGFSKVTTGKGKKKKTEIKAIAHAVDRKIGPIGTPYVMMKGIDGWFAKKINEDGTMTINVRPRPFLFLHPRDADAIMLLLRDRIAEIMSGKKGLIA